ncbi:DUF3846 domain-containing protein [Microbacterium oxydans]|nr:DUF3846 domain-containing protein [Microbacterium oxydans]
MLPRGLPENQLVLGRGNSKEVGLMVQGIVIPADAESPLWRRDFARLEDYQAAVGGWIEAVDLLDFGVTIYVNEEGRLRHLAVQQPSLVPVLVPRPRNATEGDARR